MVDKVRVWTDLKLKTIEKKVANIYKQAEKEMKEKWDAYMKRGEKRLSALQNAYTEALKVGDEQVIAEQAERLKKAKESFLLQNEHYKKMVDSVTLDMAKVNEKALSYIHSELPEIYAVNYAQANEVIKNLDVDFTLPNKAAIKRMVLDGDIKTPFMRFDNKKYINIPKDKRWNTRFINSEVLQGIIQGEDIRKISNRIFPEIMSKTTYPGLTQKGIEKRNRKVAIRNARTLVTGAENRGKWDSYKELDKRGIVQKKVWIATSDSRTRDWHLMMDGQEVELDEEFEDGNGDTLRYPGDPQAEPRTVYNCRCAMVTDVIGFRNADGTIRRIEEVDEGQDLHDEQIEREKERRIIEAQRKAQQAQSQDTHTVVNGQDISATWQRRPDKFDFEIEDVMNAQGFDGKPRVVSQEEFNKAVKAANGGDGFIAQRTYSAPDQDTLDMYRDQLYNGKWYVDCSTGGAQYGQGMYCAADYMGKLSDGIKEEMEHYRQIGIDITKEDAFSYKVNKWKYKEVKEKLNLGLSEKQFNAWKESRIRRGSIVHDKKLRETVQSINEKDSNLLGDFYKKEHDIFRKTFKGFNYTETLTLDPSAKILTIRRLDDVFNRVEEQYILGRIKNQSQKKLYNEYINLQQRIDSEKNVKTLESLYEKREAIRNDKKWGNIDEYRKDFDKEYRQIYNKDIGVIATMFGYDAINAVGHGKSGSYTVILNRTKVIILGR